MIGKNILLHVLIGFIFGQGVLASESVENQNHENTMVQISQAKVLFEQGEYKECLAALPVSVSTNRVFLAELHTLKAKCLLKMGNIQDALEWLNGAVYVLNDADEARLLRAQIHKHMNNTEKAVLDWAFLMPKGVELPQVYEGFGDFAVAQEQYLDAGVFYTYACSVDPKNAFLRFKRGRVLFVLGELERAEKDFELSYSLEKNLEETYCSQWKSDLFSFFEPTEKYNLRDLYVQCLVEQARQIILQYDGRDEELDSEDVSAIISYLNRAEAIGYPNRKIYFLRSMVYAYTKDFSESELNYNRYTEMLVADPEFNSAEIPITKFLEIEPRTRDNILSNLVFLIANDPSSVTIHK